jgi:hypothetical protein
MLKGNEINELLVRAQNLQSFCHPELVEGPLVEYLLAYNRVP